MKLIPAAVSALGLALAGAAFGQEAIQTGNGGAPPAAAATAPESDEAWARRTLDAAAAKAEAKPAPSAACAAAKPSDGRPHGEVWAGIGTRGYRQAGGVVTQPLGACGSVTLMVDHTEFGDGRAAGRAR